MQILELTTETAIEKSFGLMAQLRESVRADTYVKDVLAQMREGYRLFAAYMEEKIVALAGLRHTRTLARGPHVFVDDLIVDATLRGTGVGRAMMSWICAHAREACFTRVYLDSRDTARSFYATLGFTELTSRPCWIDARALPGAGSIESVAR